MFIFIIYGKESEREGDTEIMHMDCIIICRFRLDLSKYQQCWLCLRMTIWQQGFTHVCLFIQIWWLITSSTPIFTITRYKLLKFAHYQCIGIRGVDPSRIQNFAQENFRMLFLPSPPLGSWLDKKSLFQPRVFMYVSLFMSGFAGHIMTFKFMLIQGVYNAQQ